MRGLPGALAAAVLLVLVAALAARWAETRLEGEAVALDGDTIRLGGERLRLKGLDAPEMGQLCEREARPWRCGLAAKAALERDLARGPVRCTGRQRDRYGRLLVTCSVWGADVGGALVRAGLAVAYGSYGREEAEARDARRGLWAGSFERPQDWRAAHPRRGG